MKKKEADGLRLTLIRHAKSSWKFPELSDADRPLNKRGRKNAPMMADRWAAKGFSPDRLISSPAVRALRTAEAFFEAGDIPKAHFIVDPRLYMTGYEELTRIIYNFDSSHRWVALVGHNPDTTWLANAFGGRPIGNVPTCGVVDMSFKTDKWKKIHPDLLTHFEFDYPKKTT